MDEILERIRIAIVAGIADQDIELVERLSKLYFELCLMMPPKYESMDLELRKLEDKNAGK